MRVVSICSGVGLLDLGLEWAGFRTVQFCEIDGYCQRILDMRFPGVPVHPDAWTLEPDPCDVVAAGFPCQPFSVAGRRQGDRDPRHLWPAVIRAVRMARPRYVVLENVPGLVAWGLGEVLGDLAASGFDAEWTCFRAADVGAPHRRDRWWLVATSDPDRSRVWDEQGGLFRPGWGTQAIAWAHGEARDVADAGSVRRVGGPPRIAQGVRDPEGQPFGTGLRPDGAGGERRGRPRDGGRPPVVGVVPDSDDPGRIEQRWPIPGTPEHSAVERGGWWAVEPDVGRMAHGIPSRVDRLRCLGNGIVPQCAELVGLRLQQLDGDR